MNVSAKTLTFNEHTMWVELADGRTLGVPLAWFPRLLHATPEQREDYRIGYTGNGLHWERIDEDISVTGLLAGHGDMTHRPRPLELLKDSVLHYQRPFDTVVETDRDRDE
nr:DUF2442 domain-containing protein [uncultured Halomonas sp.]